MNIKAIVGVGTLIFGALGGIYGFIKEIINISSAIKDVLFKIESQLQDLQDMDRDFAEVVKRISNEQESQSNTMGLLALQIMHLNEDLNDVYRRLDMHRRDRAGNFPIL